MRTKLATILAAVGFLLAAIPLAAHHSFYAEFDADKPIKVMGAVTKVEWENPHAWFYVDVQDESGKKTNWGFELGSPNLLIRAGWDRNTLKIGDLVTVEASLAKSGANVANAKSVVLNRNGQKLFTGSSQGTKS